MKKLIVLSAMILALPFSMMAQDDDMYFVPTKQSKVKEAKDTYFAGTNRSDEEYNRRGKFKSSVLPMDSSYLALDGIHPDSVYVDTLYAVKMLNSYNEEEDYRFSREMDRWYGIYDPWFYGHSMYWGPYRHGWYNPW